MKRFMRTIKLPQGNKIAKPVFTQSTLKYKQSHPVWHCDRCDKPVVLIESARTGQKYLSNVVIRLRTGKHATWVWHNYYPTFEPHSKTCGTSAVTETTPEVPQVTPPNTIIDGDKKVIVTCGWGVNAHKWETTKSDAIKFRNTCPEHRNKEVKS